MYLSTWRSFWESRWFPRIASGIVLVVSGLTLFGWLTGNLTIKNSFLGTSPASAFTFILISSTILLLSSQNRLFAPGVLAGMILLIGLLRMVEVIFHLDTGVDHLFVITSFGDQLILIAPNTALCFILVGLALLLYENVPSRRGIIGQLCTLLVLLITSMAVAGHLFQLPSLYTVYNLTPMSLTTASLFLVVCFGILTANLHQGLTAVLVSSTYGGAMARRLLPVAVLVPVVLAAFQVELGDSGFYTDQADVIVLSALTITVMVSIIWWNARMMDRVDRQRREAEQALSESAARYRGLFEYSNDAVIVFDAEGHYIDANVQAEYLTGYNRDELLKLSVGDLSPEREVNRTRERLKILNEEGIFHSESTLLRKDGTETSIETSIVMIFPGIYQSIIRDISKRKAAEEALRASEARYRTLFEYSSDALIVLDDDGRYLEVNSQLERLTGYTRTELLQMKLGALSPIEDTDGSSERFMALKERGVWSGDEILLRKDGSRIMVELSAVVIAPGVYQSIIHDISARKQIEENLRRSLEQEHQLNEMKTRFVSTLSHDFRNPLAVIRSSTDLLLNYGERMDAAKRQDRLEKIQQQIEHMVQLLDDILLIGKAETVGMDFKAERLNLHTFCENLITEFQAGVPTHTFVFKSSGDCAEVVCDSKLLRRALVNLLSNAVKYSPNEKSVGIDLACTEAEAVISIQDRGIGIPEEDQQHLFELFHRARNVAGIAGTGLGLSIVRQVIDIHHGTIQVESQQNIGTTFTIHLPRSQPA